MTPLLPALLALARRDLLLAFRRLGDVANPLIFLLLVVAMFPLGLGPTPETLRAIAPGVVWVVALLACLLSGDMLFRQDFDDGALEQLALSPQPLAALVTVKVLMHWLVTGLPLALLAPLLGMMLYLPGDGLWWLFLTLLLGTGTLSFVGAIGAALTVSLRRGGMLMALLVLPLYVPVLVFGAGAVNSAVAGYPAEAPLAVLAALLILAVSFAPFAIAAALRINLDG